MSVIPLSHAEENIPQLSSSEKWNERIYYISMSFPVVRYAIIIFFWLQGVEINTRDLIPIAGLAPYLREGLAAWRGTLSDLLRVVREAI